MKKLNSEQHKLRYKLKLQEAQFVACATLQDTIDPNAQVDADEAHPTLGEVTNDLLKVLQILLSDQGTLQKKWGQIMVNKETIQLSGEEQQLQLHESIKYLQKV